MTCWGCWFAFVIGSLMGYGVGVFNCVVGCAGWSKLGRLMEKWVLGEVREETKKKAEGGGDS